MCSNVLEEQFWWKNLNETTKEEFMEFIAGKKEKFEGTTLKALTSYYLLIVLVGVIGNALTAWVISISSALQTPSNYFLCNLAVIDLITVLLGKLYFLCFYLQFLRFKLQSLVCKISFLSYSFVFKFFRWKFC